MAAGAIVLASVLVLSLAWGLQHAALSNPSVLGKTAPRLAIEAQGGEQVGVWPSAGDDEDEASQSDPVHGRSEGHCFASAEACDRPGGKQRADEECDGHGDDGEAAAEGTGVETVLDGEGENEHERAVTEHEQELEHQASPHRADPQQRWRE